MKFIKLLFTLVITYNKYTEDYLYRPPGGLRNGKNPHNACIYEFSLQLSLLLQVLCTTTTAANTHNHCRSVSL